MQTTLGPQRFPTNIANQLPAQHGNEPVPIGSAAHVPTSSGPANSGGSNTLSSSAHSSHPVATGPSELSTDTVPTAGSEESSAKAQRPNTADVHDSAVQSEGSSSSTHAGEEQAPSLQPTVEDGEDDEN